MSKKKTYEVQVEFNIRKSYTVVASSEEEAIEKLIDSGIVNCICTKLKDHYEENYEVSGLVKADNPDVD
jgi:hypothetical protein